MTPAPESPNLPMCNTDCGPCPIFCGDDVCALGPETCGPDDVAPSCNSDCGCCVVDGGWTTWANSGGCSSCLQNQTRSCTNPTPACNGNDCSLLDGGNAGRSIACGASIGVCNNGIRNSCAPGTADDGAVSDTAALWRWLCNGPCSGSNSGTCTAPKVSCPSPWGGPSIASGDSVTAYAKATPLWPTLCSSQTRTCDNGNLSGGNTAQNCRTGCTGGQGKSWGFACWGTTVHASFGETKTLINTQAWYTGYTDIYCGDPRNEPSGWAWGGLSNTYCKELDPYGCNRGSWQLSGGWGNDPCYSPNKTQPHSGCTSGSWPPGTQFCCEVPGPTSTCANPSQCFNEGNDNCELIPCCPPFSCLGGSCIEGE